MSDELNHKLYSVYPRDEPFTGTTWDLTHFPTNSGAYYHHFPDTNSLVFGSMDQIINIARVEQFRA